MLPVHANCEFHKEHPKKCVCFKLEHDIQLLNYFNDHLYEIQNECPFIVKWKIEKQEIMSSVISIGSIEDTEIPEVSEIQEGPIVDENGLICSVCSTKTRDVRITKCGHPICEKCYTHRFIQLKLMSCPSCPTELNLTDIYKLFF